MTTEPPPDEQPAATDDRTADLLAACGERRGEWAGYIRHYRAAVKLDLPVAACAACLAANAERAREHYRRPGNAALAAGRVERWRRAQADARAVAA